MKTALIEIACPYPTDQLRRVAKRMAKKSANRLKEPEIAKRMSALRRLVKSERQCKLRLGDLLVGLIDSCGVRPVDLARELKERSNHLSEMYHVSRMFPLRVRQPHVPYTHYWTAMRTVRKFKAMKLDPIETLREIAANGFTQHRQVTAHFAAKLRQQEQCAATLKASRSPASSWTNQCYHADFRDLLSVIPDQSVKILHVDPPYASYRRLADGRYSAGSVTSLMCDNPSAAEAIQLTADLLCDWPTKLVRGGVLLLWQAAGPMRKQIAQAIETHRWEVETVAIWDKGGIQPGDFTSPYSVQTEWLWVLRRAGDKLNNHNGSARGDILRFSPTHHLLPAHHRLHGFEKPMDLCRFLIGKHSYVGDTVVDLCACTGSFARAAAEMDRCWVYVESHEANYALGLERMNGVTHTSSRIAV